jgi:hypothetical protein
VSAIPAERLLHDVVVMPFQYNVRTSQTRESLMTSLNPLRTKGVYDPDTRGTAILVGLLFIAATLTFMIGDSLIAGAFASTEALIDRERLAVGVGLIATCGVAVAAIGVALVGILRRFQSGLAWAYMTFRLLECAAIFGLLSSRRTPRSWLITAWMNR